MIPSQNDKPVKRPKRSMKLPNGFGSVSFLGGNRRKPFAARKTVGRREDGTPIQKAIGYYHTRAEALQALADYNNNPYTLEKSATLRTVFEAAFEDKFGMKFSDIPKNSGKPGSSSSMYPYRTGWNNLPDQIKDTPLLNINSKMAQDAINELDTAPRQTGALLCLRLALGTAYDQGLIPRDYRPILKVTAEHSPKERTIFTAEEIASLWNRLPDRTAAQILILLYTGMRANELIGQDPKAVFLDEGYMIGGSKTAAGRNRIIPIHPAVADLVRDLVVERKDGGPMMYNLLLYHFRKYFPGHTIHETRHTFITAWTVQRLDPNILRAIVGHSPKGITEKIYTHRDAAVLVAEMRKLDRRLLLTEEGRVTNP